MLRRRLRALFGDRKGVAAIEFAFALPILCMMVFALYEISEGVICYYKLVDAANSVADLVGQTTTTEGGIGNTDFNNLYTAGQMIMSPDSGSTLKLAIASVTFNSTGKSGQVAWQVERGGAAEMTNAVTATANLGIANGSVIVVQGIYTYTSALNYFVKKPISMSYQAFALPRNMATIPCPPPNSSQSCN